MNKLASRFIVRVEPFGTMYYWSAQYAPSAGHGPKRTSSGYAETRQKAIDAAIAEAGRLAKPQHEGRAA